MAGDGVVLEGLDHHRLEQPDVGRKRSLVRGASSIRVYAYSLGENRGVYCNMFHRKIEIQPWQNMKKKNYLTIVILCFQCPFLAFSLPNHFFLPCVSFFLFISSLEEIPKMSCNHGICREMNLYIPLSE